MFWMEILLYPPRKKQRSKVTKALILLIFRYFNTKIRYFQFKSCDKRVKKGFEVRIWHF